MVKIYVVSVLSMKSGCLKSGYSLLEHHLCCLFNLFEVVEVHRVRASVHLALLLQFAHSFPQFVVVSSHSKDLLLLVGDV